MKPITNKVAQSDLIAISLEDFLPSLVWKGVDIADFLEDGFLLREKKFRAQLKSWEVEKYRDTGVFMFCSSDAIFPEWVFLLLSTQLEKITPYRFIGNETEAQSQLLLQTLQTLDYTKYQDKSLIIKGCSLPFVKPEALLYFYNQCLPQAKSIMFGEACSAVPIYKKPKTHF